MSKRHRKRGKVKSGQSKPASNKTQQSYNTEKELLLAQNDNVLLKKMIQKVEIELHEDLITDDIFCLRIYEFKSDKYPRFKHDKKSTRNRYWDK